MPARFLLRGETLRLLFEGAELLFFTPALCKAEGPECPSVVERLPLAADSTTRHTRAGGGAKAVHAVRGGGLCVRDAGQGPFRPLGHEGTSRQPVGAPGPRGTLMPLVRPLSLWVLSSPQDATLEWVPLSSKRQRQCAIEFEPAIYSNGGLDI